MLSLMLVEDDFLRAAPLKQSLTDAGYEVIGHVSGTANLDDAVRELKLDIVIIDTDSPCRDTAYSTQTGHSFHGKVDSRSVATRGF